MATELMPVEDRIVVRAIDETVEKVGSIIIPDFAKEKPQIGEVLAIGPGRVLPNGQRIPVCVTVGMRVLYGKYSGTAVTVDGEELLILREADVLAGLREQAALAVA